MKKLISILGIATTLAFSPAYAQDSETQTLPRINANEIQLVKPEQFKGFYIAGTTVVANYDTDNNGKTDMKLFYPITYASSANNIMMMVEKPTNFWYDKNKNGRMDDGEYFEIDYENLEDSDFIPLRNFFREDVEGEPSGV